MKMEHMKKFFHDKKIFIIAAVILLLLAAVIWLCIFFAGQQDKQDTSALTANDKSSHLAVSSEQAIASEAADSTIDSANADASIVQEDSSAAGLLSSKTSSAAGGAGTAAGKPAASAHEHDWTEHKAKRWHENIVTVEDVPAQTKKVQTYHLYWWDTKKWQDTTDPDVFDQWSREKIGWMKEYGYSMPPELYQGTDENGNPVYLNDHSIITTYETIPAVTHEEDRGWWEEYTDYLYCRGCGLRLSA